MPSLSFRRAIQARTTEEEFIILVRITHPDIDPIEFPDGVCVAQADTNVVSNGIEYVAYGVEIDLPEQNPEQVPRSKLVIDNVDPKIMQAVRFLQGTRPQIDLSVIMRSAPDQVEYGPIYFEMTRVPFNRYTITADLQVEPLLNQRWPKDQMTPATHPGIF